MVFIRKQPRRVQGFNVGLVMNRQAVKGEVGIEIEVEGKKLLTQDYTPAGWSYHQDGSLRGEENAEYVLTKPIALTAVPEYLDKLWNAFKAKGSSLDDSNRTSVHVHLNVQSFFFNRLTSLMALYFTMEEILTEWCGDHRVGNLFCLRAKDAPNIITQIKRFIVTDGKSGIGDNQHYAGLNTHALVKFGSLEFRTLRGCEKETILEWVRILQRLYELSENYPDPRAICAEFSSSGPLGFFEAILGDSASVVRRGVSMSDQDIRESMYNGIRMAQDLCYSRDWAVFEGVNLKADPFGRDPRKLAAAIGGVTGAAPPSDFEQFLATHAAQQGPTHTMPAGEIQGWAAVPSAPPLQTPGFALNTLMPWAEAPQAIEEDTYDVDF